MSGSSAAAPLRPYNDMGEPILFSQPIFTRPGLDLYTKP